MKIAEMVDAVETYHERRGEERSAEAVLEDRASTAGFFFSELAVKVRALVEHGPSESLSFTSREIEFLRYLREHKLIDDARAEAIGEEHLALLRKAKLPRARRDVETKRMYEGQDPKQLVERGIFSQYNPLTLSPETLVDLAEMSAHMHSDEAAYRIDTLEVDSEGNVRTLDSDLTLRSARQSLREMLYWKIEALDAASLPGHLEEARLLIANALDPGEGPYLVQGLDRAVRMINLHGTSDDQGMLAGVYPQLLERLFSSDHVPPSRFQNEAYSRTSGGDMPHTHILSEALEFVKGGPNAQTEAIAVQLNTLIKNDPSLIRPHIAGEVKFGIKSGRFESILKGIPVDHSVANRELSAHMLAETIAASLSEAARYYDYFLEGQGNHVAFDEVNPSVSNAVSAIRWFQEAHPNPSNAIGFLPPKYRNLDQFARELELYVFNNDGQRPAKDAARTPPELIGAYQNQGPSFNEYRAIRSDFLAAVSQNNDGR